MDIGMPPSPIALTWASPMRRVCIVVLSFVAVDLSLPC
jgi:hypothetical protein